ncbi:MAG: enoyl-CoA hydratase/isomerase family protein [Elusimicrobia bacterium]|nr:enoyl-CoA hydratase/isomerase family protein [Elusimicrobiota bacterium]
MAVDALPREEVYAERDGAVGVVRLNRPQVLNALSYSVVEKLVTCLEAFDADPEVGCLLLAGSEKAFAAGADINELEPSSPVDMVLRRQMERWDRLRRLQKPLVGAVSGYALGGGCELALACDMIVASESAVFGQPETDIGTMPGAGGTQRLTRAVGKAVAMEMILAGRRLTAREALAFGLVNKVVPVESWYDEALALARAVAKRPAVAAALAKDAVSRAQDLSLEEGLEYERKLFYLTFASADQKEGMKAFREKRRAEFKGG